jgi:uncharacterized small protein (DUF1192 family)
MEDDDLEPRASKVEPIVLAKMSIEALHEYIGELEAEIARAKAIIADKERARADAETAFRT